MKTLVLSACALSVLGLAGCAPAPLMRADAAADGRSVCNAGYMDQVDRAARQQSVDVHWVNCPTVRRQAVNG